VAEVEHGRDGDEDDAQQFHRVAEVEGPGAVAEQELWHERPAEPDAADADQQVRRAARQRVGPRGAQREQREAGGAEDEQHDRRAAAGLGDARDCGGEEQADGAEPDDRDGEACLKREHGTQADRPAHRRQRAQCEYGGAGGQ
jgi:hypothetical protein